MATKNKLIDKWFVVESFDGIYKVLDVGTIIEDLGQHLYLVQNMEYIGWEPGVMHVIDIKRALGDGENPVQWVFFEDKDHVKFYLEHRTPKNA